MKNKKIINGDNDKESVISSIRNNSKTNVECQTKIINRNEFQAQYMKEYTTRKQAEKEQASLGNSNAQSSKENMDKGQEKAKNRNESQAQYMKEFRVRKKAEKEQAGLGTSDTQRSAFSVLKNKQRPQRVRDRSQSNQQPSRLNGLLSNDKIKVSHIAKKTKKRKSGTQDSRKEGSSSRFSTRLAQVPKTVAERRRDYRRRKNANKVEKSNFMERNVCRLCLQVSEPLYNIVKSGLKATYEKITDTALKHSDGCPQSVCMICHAHLKKCQKLIDMARKSEEFLSHIPKHKLSQVHLPLLLASDRICTMMFTKPEINSFDSTSLEIPIKEEYNSSTNYSEVEVKEENSNHLDCGEILCENESENICYNNDNNDNVSPDVSGVPDVSDANGDGFSTDVIPDQEQCYNACDMKFEIHEDIETVAELEANILENYSEKVEDDSLEEKAADIEEVVACSDTDDAVGHYVCGYCEHDLKTQKKFIQHVFKCCKGLSESSSV